jgi:hypothetical protein
MHFKNLFAWLVTATPCVLLAQNVGIGTQTPHTSALLHVDLGSSASQGLLVTGESNNIPSVPDLGPGRRLMFYPGKAAFRAGLVNGIEWDNTNVGSCSIAMGLNTMAKGSYTTAMGVATTAIGEYSTAMGYATTAGGYYSTAMGRSTIASGDNATAMGFFTKASGEYSTALGYVTEAKAFGGLSVGLYNNIDDNPNAESAISTDRIFQLGNGTSQNNRSNAMTVLRNGNTGIGIVDPTHRLDLAGRIRIRSGGTGSTSAGIWLNKIDNSGLLGFVGVDGNNDIGIYSNTSGWSFVMDDATGNAKVKGTVTANGVTLTSDERLKKDITPLDEAMPLLEKLNGYQYHWKDASLDASLQTGLLAQEVEKVLPELVKTDDNGMKSVNYIGLIPYMLEAAKEQKVVITTQQKQIDELKKLVTDLLKK